MGEQSHLDANWRIANLHNSINSTIELTSSNWGRLLTIIQA